MLLISYLALSGALVFFTIHSFITFSYVFTYPLLKDLEEAPKEYIAYVKIPKQEDVVTLIKRGISLDHPSKDRQTFEGI